MEAHMVTTGMMELVWTYGQFSDSGMTPRKVADGSMFPNARHRNCPW